MPLLQINTNLPRSAIPANLLSELHSLLVQLVGKPEKFVTLQLNPDQLMTFAGTTDPCVFCQLMSLGRISKDENAKYTAALMEKLSGDLKVPATRIYIFFKDAKREDVGWDGKTFA